MHLASFRERDKWVVLLLLLWWFCICCCCWHVGDLGIKVANMLGSSCTLGFEVGDNWRIFFDSFSQETREWKRERERGINELECCVCVSNCCTLQGFIRGGFALVNLECSNLIWSIAHVGRVDTALMLLLDTATIYQLKRLEILFFLKKKKISISSLFWWPTNNIYHSNSLFGLLTQNGVRETERWWRRHKRTELARNGN